MRILASLLFLLVLPSLSAGGEIYRHKDAAGRTVFTDVPPEDAERVALPPLNTLPSPARRATDSAEGGEKPAGPVSYTSLTLGGAPAGETLLNPEGGITITATPDVPLAPGDTIVFFRDGREVSRGQGAWSIGQPDRGTYTITASVVSPTGKVLVSAAPLTFHVQRPRAR